MGRFLLARVGEPRTLTAGKQTASLVQLSDLAAAISAVRVYRTDKPWPIATKAAWRPRNRELLLHTSPVQYIYASAALDSGLSTACITRHLLLHFRRRIIEIAWQF